MNSQFLFNHRWHVFTLLSSTQGVLPYQSVLGSPSCVRICDLQHGSPQCEAGIGFCTNVLTPSAFSCLGPGVMDVSYNLLPIGAYHGARNRRSWARRLLLKVQML